MISTAALSFCGLFTSCTHDFDDSGYSSAEKSVISTYQEAFVTAFGQPAPTQTWGFGPSTKANTRATEAEWTQLATANNWEKYARSFDAYLNPNIDSIKDTWREISSVAYKANQLSVASERLTVEGMRNYVTLTNSLITDVTSNGNHTLSDKTWYYDPADYVGHGDGKHFYVPQGTEITEVFHINGNENIYNDAVIFVEGKVHLKGNTLNSVTIVVGSTGELIVEGDNANHTQSMSNAARILVMGGGKITGNDNVLLDLTNGSPSYNAGTIEFDGRLNVNGCDFYNNGTINVDVLTNTTKGGRITNFGKITARTNLRAADAYNMTMVNGCYWKYKEDAGIGSLIMLNNSRLDVGGTAEFNNSDQYLYNYSVINVGTLYVNATAFFGSPIASDLAIIKADNIFFAGRMYINEDRNDQYQTARNTWVNRKVSGKGKIYLDWDNSETYTNEGKITLDNGYTMLSVVRESNYDYVTEATATFSIPAGDCTGDGYNDDGDDGGGGGGGGETTTPKIRIICEDLSARNESAGNSDWDFNDVVFDVELAENNITAIVTLLAAGGTLPLTVGWEGDDIDDETYQNYEVHKKFADYNTDKSISTTSMINTGSTGEKYTFRDCNKAYIALPVKQEWINQAASSDPEDILKAVALNIPVKVYKLVGAVRTWVPMEAITGEPAAKIAVGTDYNWCDERTDIRNNFKGSNRNNEYPLFNMFVKGIISESGWYTRTTLTNDEVDSYLNN